MDNSLTRISSYPLTTNLIESHQSNQIQNKTNPTTDSIATKGPSDIISLSPQGRQLSQINRNIKGQDSSNEKSKPNSEYNEQEIDTKELKEIQQLKKRDTEVRAHEQAHLSAAGQYAAGGASFSYKTGPNGQRYAVGGEVPIDMSKEATPEETLIKMSAIQRAALAPASPSSADRRIAAQASLKESQARSELQGTTTENTTDDPSQRSITSKIYNDNSQIQQNSRHMILKVYQAQTSILLDPSATA